MPTDAELIEAVRMALRQAIAAARAELLKGTTP